MSAEHAIASVDSFLVPPCYHLVRVRTHDGAEGWGEAGGEAWAPTVQACVRQVGNRLLGADSRQIADHAHIAARAGFFRGGPIIAAAVSGVEQALWDIHARRLGVPLSHLLGGPVRDRVRTYAWIDAAPSDGTTEKAVESAVEKVRQGFTCLKWCPTDQLREIDRPAAIRQTVDRLEAIRGAIGDDVDIILDLHGRATPPMARLLIAAVAPYRPLYVEEPVRPEHLGSLAQVVADSPVPIGMGERIHDPAGLDAAIRAGIGVAQPDLAYTGGVLAFRSMADRCAEAGVAFAPHCAIGPVALAASLQVSIGARSLLVHEQAGIVAPDRDHTAAEHVLDYDAIPFRDGFLEPAPGDGIGITVDGAAVEREAVDPRAWTFEPPRWKLDDRSWAEY